MKHIFIFNPQAGGGIGEKKYLPEIMKAVKSANLDYEIHRSLGAAEITSYVKRKCEEGGDVRFYALGGDGTVHDVMSGLACQKNAQLAIIPCGTGNDFVKNWTNCKNTNIEDAINGTVISIDAVKYGDSYSINMINIGADCDVVVEAGKIEQFHGAINYLIGALKILPKGPVYKMRYSIDDGEEIEGDFLLMCIANGQFCGGGFKSCPKASINDGYIDLCLVKPVGGLEIIPLMMKYRTGAHLTHPKTQELLIYKKCKKFKLTAIEPVNVSNDGEVSEFTSAEFEIVPNAINLVIPRGSELIYK